MLDLLWSIFDLVTIILFVYFFLKIMKLGLSQIKPKWRLVAVPVLLVGIISFLSNQKKIESESKIIEVEYSVDYYTVPVSLINDLSVQVVRKKSDGSINPFLSDSFYMGFVLGREWSQTTVNETPSGIEIEGKVKYYLIGWNFMSFPRSILIKPDSPDNPVKLDWKHSI
ncbi:hypothetical protein [Algoriphagus vanfongensis]|uniref:hypothetical protein n=1 Tax=Algoriphagus vanfongensis TaxID=426371 RepID=UPI000428D859|nr:hypothetical protein [Algoriphagus vanfongensis]